MRRHGVIVPKHELRQESGQHGTLSIFDTRENGYNRIVKLARLVWMAGDDKRSMMLYEPHIIWMNEGRFMLAGFERVEIEARITDFAQSWLCNTAI